ncbi:type II secretion system minor pseudopilin GspI [Neptunicella sp. SCSIO 80796]|uniref:type II secretion system minor pseudopilin GspI n=1 Tax=Neptunicella plasticusilytica TaxID=3117012 RepID=UPI003A4D2BEF
MRSNNQKAAGMTLLEVMVALAIFALTGTAIMKAATEHLHGVGVLEELTFATWVANNRLTEIHLESQWPPQNNKKGSQEMAGKTWYWQQKVVETNDKDLRMVEINVSLNERGESPISSVQSFFSKPPPALTQ